MSKYEDGSYGSIPGIALIAKVLAGRCQMKYTRVAVGKGYIPDGETPKTMTEPAEYVMDASIVGVTNPVAGECQVTITIDSANVETGFYCTGVLLYAEDPDEGEVPYTYLALENEPEWIRPKTSIVGKLATIDLIAAVGDVDKVTAVIDPDAAATIALVQQLIEEHNADPNAHSMVGSAIVKEITIPAEGWALDETGSDESYMGIGEYHYYVDVTDEEVTDDQVPIVALHKDALETAKQAGLCPTAQTVTGAVRFWARYEPMQDMEATLALLAASGSGQTGGGGTYVLPVATATTLGGVKLGEGFSTTLDGTLSYTGTGLPEDAFAQPDETQEMLDEVLPLE